MTTTCTARSHTPQTSTDHTTVRRVATNALRPNPFSLDLYGNPDAETDGLIDSIRVEGILVPLVITRTAHHTGYEVLSGHRRLSCARQLGLSEVPCIIRAVPPGTSRQLAILDYNRQRVKSFSQRMREADALEVLLRKSASDRRLANLRRGSQPPERPDDEPDRRNSDTRRGRTDSTIARIIGLGGKDQYRQARAVWKAADENDPRAQAAVSQLDAGSKTIHAAYKDLRRRDRFSASFQPTPYDVWSFKHDRAFGLPHPGSIPASIVAHTIHYFSAPGDLVVDPMAGGGTTLDVCASMGRRCLAYDIHPVRHEITQHDIRKGLPSETQGCDLIFCDPPYHTMMAHRYAVEGGAAEVPLTGWIAFLQIISRVAFSQLRPGGVLTLLLANQTEKDLPLGHGYIDHAFLGYSAMLSAGFLPCRRISCPMDGSYRPQDVRRARADGRLLGQVRDLLVMRKPLDDGRLFLRFPAGQLVDLAADEGVREGRIAADDGTW